MKIRTFAAALALAGTPAIVAAQQTQAPAAGQHGQHARGERGRWQQGGERRGGIQRLIARRDQLHLTADQVSRLQAIQQRLESQNRPLQERMRALFQQSGLPDFRAQRGQGRRDGGQAQGQRRERPQLTEQQRQQLRQLREQSKPIRDQLRQNQQAAMRDVQAILTPAQKQQLQQLRQQHQQRRGGEGRHGRHAHGRNPGA